MRITCHHCNAKAVIYGKNQQSDTVTDYYCRCTNSECLCGFVTTLSYSHDLQPPINSQNYRIHELLLKAFQQLPREQAKKIIADLNIQ